MVLKRTLSISKASDAADEEEELEKFKDVIKNVFSHLDRNEVGYVNREQVQMGLQTLELPSKAGHVEGIFSVFDDTKEDGVIHYSDFVELALHRRQSRTMKHALIARLAEVFENLDQTSDGFIREEDIRRALDTLDIVASDAQIMKLMSRADKDRDGKISRKEFQEFLVLCTPASVAEVFDYWAHASAIDIGEDMTAPDNFETHAQALVTLVAGAIAGAVSRTATAPFDRLKTLLQSGKRTGGIVTGMANIYRQEGLRAYWNGNGTNVLKIMPENAIRFLSYEAFKGAIWSDRFSRLNLADRFIAGALAGSVAQFTIYPLEIAKTRLAVAEKGEFKGIGDCIARIVGESGVKGLLRGLPASLMGIVPYSGTDLAIFFTMRARWMAANPDAKEGPGVMTLLGFGALSSTCGQLVAYPLQLVRTKLQAQGMPGVPYAYKGTWDCFRRTVKHEGVMGLYRGLRPNFLKALPAIAISYAVYDKARAKLSSLVPKQGSNGRRILVGGDSS
ncbi:unnamed protein product [Ascophyllum nodosum]